MSLRRVYSETLPYEQLVRPRTLGLLARYGLEIVLAVRPWDLAELPRVAKTFADAGVALSIWPMLSDEEGRWANVHNAPAFAELTRSACDRLVADGVPPRDVLLDLEPPFSQTRSLAAVGAGADPAGGEGARLVTRFASRLSPSAYLEFEAACDVFSRTVAEIHARDIGTSMAVWPLVALDPAGADTWQSILGTPVDALQTGHVSVMMYTSILERWSRGALRRRDARALLGAATARAVRRWGVGAGISLGCVGVGALEDEPTYRHPRELAEDARVARAAGCERLALFDLGGVMRRPPAEAWFEAFVEPSETAASEREGYRLALARAAARAATWTLGRVRAAQRPGADVDDPVPR